MAAHRVDGTSETPPQDRARVILMSLTLTGAVAAVVAAEVLWPIAATSYIVGAWLLARAFCRAAATAND